MTHCIDQQSFYPLHPPSRALRVRMDYNEHRSLYIHDKLDLLILPSNLKHFAKIDRESNTLCINPSFLTRMNRGGTYAVLHIADSNCYDVDDYTQRIRCDIFRIWFDALTVTPTQSDRTSSYLTNQTAKTMHKMLVIIEMLIGWWWWWWLTDCDWYLWGWFSISEFANI